MTATADDLIRAIRRAEEYVAICNSDAGVSGVRVHLGLYDGAIAVVALRMSDLASEQIGRLVSLSDLAAACADISRRCPLLLAIDDALNEVRSRNARSH